MDKPIYSRNCIHDTLMYKRDRAQWNHPNALARSLYVHTIRDLRQNQLAPHTEKRMVPERFGQLYFLKRTAPDIVVVIRKGRLQEVRSSNPYTKLFVAEYDAARDDLDAELVLEEAEERGSASDMYTVYQRRTTA